MKRFILLALLSFLVFSLFFGATPAYSQKVKVEVETGPEFKDGDEGEVKGCFASSFENRFPFDFASAPVDAPGVAGCPFLDIWDNRFEFCWLVDIWHLAEPGFLIGMIFVAIQRL
ncbi:MAG: hypothetical protein F6K24_07450 [Okeania sp. SIO2D1]|nr:hypothetical protein [Okeania sp. SIO2D1]